MLCPKSRLLTDNKQVFYPISTRYTVGDKLRYTQTRLCAHMKVSNNSRQGDAADALQQEIQLLHLLFDNIQISKYLLKE